MSPSHVRHRIIVAQPPAATVMARNDTWFGVTRVPLSIHTSTAAGGREIHSVQKLSRFFFDCR